MRKPIEFGVVRPGLLADMVLVDENPLKNFKVLFGHGAVRLDDETGEPVRVGGIKWTIKDGIVYDAKQLLADVRAMVDQQKQDVQQEKTEEETGSEPSANGQPGPGDPAGGDQTAGEAVDR